MRLQQLGHMIRRVRLSKRVTQAALAERVGLSRTTVNQLENGVVPDLGFRKAQAVLAELGLDLQVRPAPRRPNYVRMALGSANSSYREKLSETELTLALLTGRIPRGRRPHFRTLFEETPPGVVRGLFEELGKYGARDRIRRNARVIAESIGTLNSDRAVLEAE